METNFRSYTSLVEGDAANIWHPYTQSKTSRQPIPITRGKAAYLYDAQGRSYLDLISSWWVNLHGHAHPHITKRIKAQLDDLEHVMFADFTHQPAVELAENLLPLLPGKMSKLFYSDNGSTAVETALKMVFQYWHNKNQSTKKHRVVCFNNSFHGDTFGAMSAAGKNHYNKPFWRYLFGIETIPIPAEGDEEHSLNALKRILATGEVACFIFEPLVLGAAGMKMYSAEQLNALLKMCREHEVLLIADEVMTGFGRTGTLFACEQLQEKPDLICLSKGITGGFLPLGATACTTQIHDAFVSENPHHTFLHGHSFSANPLACSSALASLELLLKPECDRQRSLIAAEHSAFVNAWEDHPRLQRCEQKGTILALEYKTNSSYTYSSSLRDNLHHYFLDNGLLMRPIGNVVYLIPPYCIQKEELQLAYKHIIQTLEGNQ